MNLNLVSASVKNIHLGKLCNPFGFHRCLFYEFYEIVGFEGADEIFEMWRPLV